MRDHPHRSSRTRTVSVVLPIRTSEPSRRPVCGDPVAVDEHAVGRAEVVDLEGEAALAAAGDGELDVPPAHAGVVDPQVGLGAAADDQAGRLQRVPGAVDLEEGPGAADLGRRRVAGDLGLGAAADPEPAGGQVLGRVEGDASPAPGRRSSARRRGRAAGGPGRRPARCRTAPAAPGRCRESSTWKSLGTRRRSRERICALLSHSRWSAAAISTGCTAERKARANAPEIICSSLFSSRWSPPTSPSFRPRPGGRARSDGTRSTTPGRRPGCDRS